MDERNANQNVGPTHSPNQHQYQISRSPNPVTVKTFYRELVEFAVFLCVTMFPIYLAFNSMTIEVQQFLSSQIAPVKDSSGNIIDFFVNKFFAQCVVIVSFFIGFTTLFFIRHSMKKAPPPASIEHEDVAIVEENILETKNKEIYRLKSRIIKDMIVLRTIHNQVYDDSKARLNYSSIRGIYYVNANGDLKVYKNIILKADEKEGPFWMYYATGDEYSTPMESIDDLDLSVAAEETKTDLVFLPLEDEPLKKKIAVYFLPLLKPGETRAFKLYYEWPGNFLKLIKTETVSYDWQSRSHSPEAIGDFYAEWIFDEGLGEVTCQNTGSKPEGLKLTRTDERSPCRWIFHGDQIPLGGTPLELTFSLSNNKTGKK